MPRPSSVTLIATLRARAPRRARSPFPLSCRDGAARPALDAVIHAFRNRCSSGPQLVQDRAVSSISFPSTRNATCLPTRGQVPHQAPGSGRTLATPASSALDDFGLAARRDRRETWIATSSIAGLG